MQLTLSKRYSRGFTVTSNYTLSKVEGNFGDEVIPYNEFTLDKRDPLVWGPLSQDRTSSLHDVVGVGSARQQHERTDEMGGSAAGSSPA